MAFVIVGLLTLFAAVVVVYPFVRRKENTEGSIIDATSARVFRREREEIYHEIRALQLEYELGTLEETEYRRQMQMFRVEAAHLLREQDISVLGHQLEEEILAQRSVAKVVGTPLNCPTCGSTMLPESVCLRCKPEPSSDSTKEDNGTVS